MPRQIGHVAYGVCHNSDDEGSFDYLRGVEVADYSQLPPGFSAARLPQQIYAVFIHRDHIATIRRTWATIWSPWLPQSHYEAVDAPYLERYDAEFDSHTGLGGLEIGVPVKARR